MAHVRSQADKDKDNRLTLEELRDVLTQASSRFSHLEEHAKFLDGKQGMARWGGMVYKTLSSKHAALRGVQEGTWGCDGRLFLAARGA